MADLLPSTPDTSAVEEAEPRVLGLDDEDADEVLAALSSTTARELLATLHDDPGPPSELADRVDTSLQNVQYHLEKLEEADLIEVIDTVYSEKGREMDVYGPTDRPLVMFAGGEREESSIKSALTRLIGGFGILGAVSLVVQALLGDSGLLGQDAAPTGGDDGAGGFDGAADGPSIAVEDAAPAGGEEALGLPPGLLFFLGGALVLLGTFAVYYWRVQR